MVYKVLGNKTGLRASLNEVLVQELHKPVIKKSSKRKVYARFIHHIRRAHSAGLRSFLFFNRGVKYLLSVIDVFIKYT